jgi:hypothetical protein
MAERIRAEILQRALEALTSDPSPTSDPELIEKVRSALKLRGVSAETLNQMRIATTTGQAALPAVWSKTYTESHSAKLLASDGTTLLEINTPLTNDELTLIDQLGFRKK